MGTGRCVLLLWNGMERGGAYILRHGQRVVCVHYDGHESGVICAATRDQVEVCMLDVTREREQGRVTQELTWWQYARHMSKAESAVALGQDGGGRVPVASTPRVEHPPQHH